MESRAGRRELKMEMETSRLGLLICVPLKPCHKMNSGPAKVLMIYFFPKYALCQWSNDSTNDRFPGTEL